MFGFKIQQLLVTHSLCPSLYSAPRQGHQITTSCNNTMKHGEIAGDTHPPLILTLLLGLQQASEDPTK